MPTWLGTARELGARVLATGHYVVNRRLADGSRALYCALETERDQSYFLFATTREQSTCCASRSAALPKSRVRELAREFGLVDRRQARQPGHLLRADRPLADVIERLRPGAAAPGDIVDLSARCWDAMTASFISPSASEGF